MRLEVLNLESRAASCKRTSCSLSPLHSFLETEWKLCKSKMAINGVLMNSVSLSKNQQACVNYDQNRLFSSTAPLRHKTHSAHTWSHRWSLDEMMSSLNFTRFTFIVEQEPLNLIENVWERCVSGIQNCKSAEQTYCHCFLRMQFKVYIRWDGVVCGNLFIYCGNSWSLVAVSYPSG